MKFLRCLSISWFPIVLVYYLCSASVLFGANAITIGIVGPMKFPSGREMWNGALMAADKINQNGGVNVGQKRMQVKLIQADSNEITSVDSAANMMEKLCMLYDVDFIVGGFRSEAVMVMQDVAMDYRKVFISIGAASPVLCDRVAQDYDRYKYYFRNGVVNSKYLAKVSFLQLDYVAQSLRKTLGIDKVKIVIATEKASWVKGLVAAATKTFPLMGLDLAGVFYLSTVASDVGPAITAIGKTKAPLVYTLFSSHVGRTFVTQAADLNLPALQVGINVEAQKHDFWEMTEGRADYVITTVPFCRGVEITQLTKSFMESYIKRFGTIPSFTSGTYSTILHSLIPAIEQAGTLDPDMFVSILENRRYETPQGFFEYEIDQLGRHRHDPKFGIKDAVILGGQWLDGQMKGIWPNNYQETPEMKPLTFKGIVDLEIPPRVISAYKR